MSGQSIYIKNYAGKANKKLKEGLPLEAAEIKALVDYFVMGDNSSQPVNYDYAHLRFAVEQKRIFPEEIVKNTTKESVNQFGYLILLSYLIRNGMDVNYYFSGPYNVKNTYFDLYLQHESNKSIVSFYL